MRSAETVKVNSEEEIEKELQASKGNELLAVTGDFNICERAQWQVLPGEGVTEYAALSRSMQELCSATDLFGGGPHVPTMRPQKDVPSLAFDHMFVSQRLRDLVAKTSIEDTRGDDQAIISDHFGLLVDVYV